MFFPAPCWTMETMGWNPAGRAASVAHAGKADLSSDVEGKGGERSQPALWAAVSILKPVVSCQQRPPHPCLSALHGLCSPSLYSRSSKQRSALQPAAQ